MHTVAIAISWAMCLLILAWSIHRIVEYGHSMGLVVLIGIVISHVWLMLKKTNQIAFGLTCMEILFTMLFFHYYIYPPPDLNPPIVPPFKHDLLMWVVGMFALGAIFKICLDAARLTRES